MFWKGLRPHVLFSIVECRFFVHSLRSVKYGGSDGHLAVGGMGYGRRGRHGEGGDYMYGRGGGRLWEGVEAWEDAQGSYPSPRP